MTDREKLMGLIQCAYAVHTQYASDGRPIGRYVRRAVADDHSVAVLTDILLDSGVTVRKTGRWIDNCCYNTCSVCQKSVHVWNDDGDMQNFDFCPNCGAKMEVTT